MFPSPVITVVSFLLIGRDNTLRLEIWGRQVAASLTCEV
jgi:hypothetical protein